MRSAGIRKFDKYKNMGIRVRGGTAYIYKKFRIYFTLNILKSIKKNKNCKKIELKALFISLKHKITSKIL